MQTCRLTLSCILLQLLCSRARGLGAPTNTGNASVSLQGAFASHTPPAVWQRQRESRPELNVTGSYKGVWRQERSAGGRERWLSKPRGTIIYLLRAFPSATEGLHDVEGDVIVRDGVYISDADSVLRATGVYVAATGKLHATAEALSEQLLTPLTAAEGGNTSGQGEGLLATAEYRSGLRERAALFAGRNGTREEGEQPQQQARCSFTLDLRVAAVEGQASVWGEQGARSGTAGSDGGPSSVSALLTDPAAVRRRRHLSDSTSIALLQESVEARPGGEQEGSGQLLLEGLLSSPACGLELSVNGTTRRLEAQFEKAVVYTYMVSVVSAAQVVLVLGQLQAARAQNAAARVSLLTIGLQGIADAYLCLLHITTGVMVDALFNSFATAAFFQFSVFAIFEQRFMVAVLRARQAASPLDGFAAHRQLSLLHFTFYVALMTTFFITYFLRQWVYVLLYVLYSFWLPQVVHCAVHEVRQPLRLSYLLGISATRLAIPLYLLACPANILKAPYAQTCAGAWWPTWELRLLRDRDRRAVRGRGLMLLCAAQRVWGPRCFVPRCLLPPKYDYQRVPPPKGGPAALREEGPRDIETGDAGAECVICMQPVDSSTRGSYMVTPCSHVFHDSCLRRWMEVKMECPTCRTALPPP